MIHGENIEIGRFKIKFISFLPWFSLSATTGNQTAVFPRAEFEGLKALRNNNKEQGAEGQLPTKGVNNQGIENRVRNRNGPRYTIVERIYSCKEWRKIYYQISQSGSRVHGSFIFCISMSSLKKLLLLERGNVVVVGIGRSSCIRVRE